ncbi:DUF1659 domain-containing protein [Crassaminicella profunda]|uniref:DUF1659 domain-containing protein n=1 Tax=Crassaminicella profunda TaxID=1286698 RepID=UPI001CA62198|nr:DUF1659 domain-containing protein [Crassaminicella profunda]QZY55852.1 DUF1659 domain-containing protein [Crassaminicella profunda]
MAVSAKLGPSKVKITFSNGVDEKGKEKRRSKSYSNIKPAANDQDIYDVATTLIGLQNSKALEVQRLDEKEIVEA